MELFYTPKYAKTGDIIPFYNLNLTHNYNIYFR
jgi:hypothetical protein